MENLKEHLVKKNIEFRQSQEIKPYLTLRIGGQVRFIIIIRENRDLEELLVFLHQNSIKFVLLGGGSNVIFPDEYSDLVVIINRTTNILREKDNMLKVSSGVTNARLLSWNIGQQIGGMEFLAGIPGTIGGAAAVNAGAFGKSTADILIAADIFTNEGRKKTVTQDYFQYGYRHSIFKYSTEVILDVYLKFENASSDKIDEKIKANIKYRKDNHPAYTEHTAGCFFKNPQKKDQKISAGKLIENSGLKGTSYRDLFISPAHANFLINRGGATFSDVSNFAEQVRRKVFRESGILLEREVIYISPRGEKY